MTPTTITSRESGLLALIKDNALTLVGRITNPKEQQIEALIPALPRKWNLKGRVTGSDIGNNCFQFRFELEEDLKRFLENIPYLFNYWMVIIQRWEPVISSVFPSKIPFWITIKGLPLHYWHDKMVKEVDQELGTLEDHELTKTTARVQVSVDGLKPLIKEMMVDFDSGEETYITLEYEKLEAHCSYCFSLLHSRRNCNMKQEEESRGVHANQSNIKEISRISTSSNVQGNQVNRQEQNKALTETGQLTFKARVDRHGNPFGERTGTKQTRVPPPANTGAAVEPFRPSWKQSPKGASHQQYSSPQYT